MEVVLLESVRGLGALGDVVRVKGGYARNWLLPRGKALRATKPNIERFEKEREARRAQLETKAEEARKKAALLEGEVFIALRQAGETGRLYGSVNARDIAQIASEAGHEIERGQIEIPQPVKNTGRYEIILRLHSEVEISIGLVVARTAEEAEAIKTSDAKPQTEDNTPEEAPKEVKAETPEEPEEESAPVDEKESSVGNA